MSPLSHEQTRSMLFMSEKFISVVSVITQPEEKSKYGCNLVKHSVYCLKNILERENISGFDESKSKKIKN